MNSNEFYNLCEASLDGINRNGDVSIQFITDIAQNVLLSVESEQNTVFSNATGRLPLITTQAGEFNYNAPADCWRITGVLVESDQPNSILDRIFYNWDYNSLSSRSGGNKLESTKISGISYYVVPFIRSWDAGDTTPARYMFTEDPGATNGVYRLWYYPKPTKLSSDSIPLSIGPPYDYMFLFPAVCAIYQGMQDGDRLAAVQKVVAIRNEYHTELNKGAQDTDLESIDRGF